MALILLAGCWLWWAGLWVTLVRAVDSHARIDRVVTFSTLIIDPFALLLVAVHLVRGRIPWYAAALLVAAVIINAGLIATPERYWTWVN